MINFSEINMPHNELMISLLKNNLQTEIKFLYIERKLIKPMNKLLLNKIQIINI